MSGDCAVVYWEWVNVGPTPGKATFRKSRGSIMPSLNFVANYVA